MKTLHTLFGTALATVAVTMIAIIMTGCQQTDLHTQADAVIPVQPTTMVYSINPTGAFNRAAIQNSPSAKPETFKIQGQETTLDLADAFSEDEFALEALPSAETVNIGLEESLHSTELSVLNAVTCKSVKRNVASDTTSNFFLEDGRVYFLTKISLPAGKYGWISHVWKHEGVEMGRSEILVEGPSYRCSSYKTICKSCAGQWTVDVTAENGEVLQSIPFEVLQANL